MMGGGEGARRRRRKTRAQGGEEKGAQDWEEVRGVSGKRSKDAREGKGKEEEGL